MTLKLTETQAVAEMAKFLYDFLPGQPHSYADQGISFAALPIRHALRGELVSGAGVSARSREALQPDRLDLRDSLTTVLVQADWSAADHRIWLESA